MWRLCVCVFTNALMNNFVQLRFCAFYFKCLTTMDEKSLKSCLSLTSFILSKLRGIPLWFFKKIYAQIHPCQVYKWFLWTRIARIFLVWLKLYLYFCRTSSPYHVAAFSATLTGQWEFHCLINFLQLLQDFKQLSINSVQFLEYGHSDTQCLSKGFTL